MHDIPNDLRITEEDVLINRVKAGHSELFEQLLAPYQRKMYLLAYSVLRDQQEAEDAVQESSMKAFMRLDQLRCNASFKCWLMQTTINEARMRRRHTSRHTFYSLDEESKGSLDQRSVVPEPVDRSENPEQALERKEMQSAVHGAFNDLPSKYRVILGLRCTEGLSLSEIGAVLNLGMPAVKTRLHRARLHLRKELIPILHAHRNDKEGCIGGAQCIMSM